MLSKLSSTYRQAYLFSAVALVAVLSSNAYAQEIVYTGDTGPDRWATLNPDWEACAGIGSGAAQSPINLTNMVVDSSLAPLELETYSTTIDVFNNGHAIEQRYAGTGSSISFAGEEYDLLQFHFHTLSEHTINSSHAPLEMHAVFSADSGAILVVGQLFEVTSGSNSKLQVLIDAGLPAFNGDAVTNGNEINVGDLLTDISQYYTYNGSLTTPPCSEVVTWVVLKDRAPISADQYTQFREILGNNFRPLQAVNNRAIRSTGNNNGGGCDYSAADVNDGWGWNPGKGESCPPLNDDNCDFSDAAVNGGWGWDPVEGESCPPPDLSSTAKEVEQAINVFINADVTNGVPMTVDAKGPVTIASAVEFPGFAFGVYDVDATPSKLKMTLATDPSSLQVGTYDGETRDLYYYEFDRPVRSASISSAAQGFVATVDVLAPGDTTSTQGSFVEGLATDFTFKNGGILITIGAGSALREVGQGGSLTVDLTFR